MFVFDLTMIDLEDDVFRWGIHNCKQVYSIYQIERSIQRIIRKGRRNEIKTDEKDYWVASHGIRIGFNEMPGAQGHVWHTLVLPELTIACAGSLSHSILSITEYQPYSRFLSCGREQSNDVIVDGAFLIALPSA